MNEFEIDLPNITDLRIEATNPELFSYDFSSFSLSNLQNQTSWVLRQNMSQKILGQTANADLVDKIIQMGDTKLVASLSEEAKKKIASGEWKLALKKDGAMYGAIKDVSSGRMKAMVELKPETVKDLGAAPELAAMQAQLAQIAEQIEDLSRLLYRVEQGQYNDRYAGFFSARQMVVEAMAASNLDLRRDLLISAVKTSNDTLAKLMVQLHTDINQFNDPKLKSKIANEIEQHIQTSMGYLNSTVQLNVIAYTALEEKHSLLAVLANYHAFISQQLLAKDKFGSSVAWRLDNGHRGEDGRMRELASNVALSIDGLMNSSRQLENGSSSYEKIANEEVQFTNV